MRTSDRDARALVQSTDPFACAVSRHFGAERLPGFNSLNGLHTAEPKAAAELARIKEALALNPTENEMKSLLADSRRAVATVIGLGRNFSSEVLVLAAEVLLASPTPRIPEMAGVCNAFSQKLKNNKASLDEAAKFFGVVTSQGYRSSPLVAQLTEALFPSDAALSTSSRHALMRSLSETSLKSHTIMKNLFKTTVWEIDKLRRSGRDSEALQEEVTILNHAAAGLDLGDAYLQNLCVRTKAHPDRKLPNFVDCPETQRFGLLKFYADFELAECASYKRLLDFELSQIRKAPFIDALAMSGELLTFKIAKDSRDAVRDNLKVICDTADFKVGLDVDNNEQLIAAYVACLDGSFYHAELHSAFEELIVSRLRSSGRQSRTSQRDCAILCEIAATVTSSGAEFKSEVVHRADQHLRSVLDDKKSAFQLMTYFAYLAPEKWGHVVAMMEEIPATVPLTLSREGARCCYLLSRMSGLPTRVAKIVADEREIESPMCKLSEYLAQTWEKITRPQGNVDLIGIQLGVVDVVEGGRRAMALLEPEHPSVVMPTRDLSQIYEELFSVHAPKIRVLRVTVPTGNEEAKETALRAAIFLAIYNEELTSTDSHPRIAEFN